MVNKNKYVKLISGYFIVLPVLILLGLSVDAYWESQETAVRLSSISFTTLVVLSAIYLTRGITLVAPLLYLSQKWHKVTVYALRAMVISEALIIYIVLRLLTQGACTDGGWLSSCGWGFLVYYAIAISCILQLLGMLVGALTAKFTK